MQGCPSKCVQATVSKQPCPSRCVQASVSKQVCPSKCVQASASKQVCPSKCVQASVSASVPFHQRVQNSEILQLPQSFFSPIRSLASRTFSNVAKSAAVGRDGFRRKSFLFLLIMICCVHFNRGESSTRQRYSSLHGGGLSSSHFHVRASLCFEWSFGSLAYMYSPYSEF